MSLLTLPLELRLQIAWSLDSQADVARLAQTCRSLYSSTSWVLYRWNRLYGNNSALNWAVLHNVPDIFHCACRAGTIVARQNLNLVHIAATTAHADMIPTLIQYGFGHSACDENGERPLSIAARHGSLQVFQALVDCGADISLSYANGQTPLHVAAGAGRTDITKLLLDAGAAVSPSLNAPNMSAPVRTKGWTPLHEAVECNNFEVARLLVQHGADPVMADLVDITGTSPLEIALTKRYIDIATFLLENGADLSVLPGADTAYPIFVATQHRDVELVKLLLQYGAETNSRGMLSPLRHALTNKLEEIAGLLLSAGADLSLAGTGGLTGLDYAARCGMVNIIDVVHRTRCKNSPPSVNMGAGIVMNRAIKS
ncbi:Ankyrin repeat and SOCS box protein 3 [Lecanicillium sp. MT-2017a]|nr:Ankyrin repeat and SOCS box protein 3 [Lecanicillium sp. MT-2017a]